MTGTPRKRRAIILAAGCGAHAVQDGLGATLYVLLPVLAQAFGLNYAQVGVVKAANNTAMMLFELPAGVLAEKLGERALLVFGLACAALGYLLLPAANGFETVILALFIVGLGAAFQHSLSSAIIARAYQDGGRRGALGIYNSAGDIGKLAFAALFTLAIGAGILWQQTVTGFGVLALVFAVLLLIVLRRMDAGGRPRPIKTDAALNTAIGWGVRDRTGFTALAVFVFFDIAVQSGFLTFLAFLMEEKSLPTSLAAFAVVLTLLGGIFGKFGCGLLAERIGARASLIMVQSLTATGIVAVLLSPPLVSYFFLPLVGIVLQGSSSITYGTVADLFHGERQSRGFAIVYSISSAAAIASPLMFGVIGDRFGLAPAMVTMALMVLLTLPLCALFRPVAAEQTAA